MDSAYWKPRMTKMNTDYCPDYHPMLKSSSGSSMSKPLCSFLLSLLHQPLPSPIWSPKPPCPWREAGQLSMAQKASRLERSRAQMWLWPTQVVRQVSLAECPWLLQLSIISKQVFSDCSDTIWLPQQCWQKRVVILLSHKNFKPCLSMLANHT